MKIVVLFPKDSEAIFNIKSNRTFGGATVQLYLLARELSANDDVEVVSFIPSYSEIEFEDKKKFHLVRAYGENDNIFKKMINFYIQLKKVSPEVIIQRGLTFKSCVMAIFCRIFKIKFIFMFAHDIESHGIYQRSRKKCLFFPLLLRNSYKLIVQNEYEESQLLEKFNYLENKVHILKKGIDSELISKKEKKKYDCVWIARCEEWKRPELFIKLSEENPDLRFLMICSPVDSSIEFFKSIQDKANSIPNLEFLDFVEYNRIYDYLAVSKIFCITSEMEGDWPMTVLEAAASGVPVLSLSLNYGNIFEKYGAGYFCKGDFNLLKKYMRKLLENDNSFFKKSNAALSYINENHNISVSAKKLLAYLN